MSHLLAFAGSNSSRSINFQLVKYTVSSIVDKEVRLLDMADMTLPVFSEDLERDEGYPPILSKLLESIRQADGLILSVNEHNSNPSAFFKNVLDWLSRMDRNFLSGTRVLLMSTSRGRRGGSASLEVIKALLPRFGGEVVASFSLPSFNHNFIEVDGITDRELANAHKIALELFLSKI
ncbi:MAG TPA: NAD(P)H-dependent oxidoreductase [Arenibacter sp.]|nr:NAD(P)H-dependent oxidoreductase [Arenibacter sp.]